MHATKAFGAEEVSLCSSLTSALDGIRSRFTPGGRAGRICPVTRRLGGRQKPSAYFKKRQASSSARIRTTIPRSYSPLFCSLRHWKAAKWATNKHCAARSSEQKMRSLPSCKNSQSYTFTAIVYADGLLLLWWWFVDYRLYRRVLSLPIVTLWILGFCLWHT